MFQHQLLELLPYSKYWSLTSKWIKNHLVFYKCKTLEERSLFVDSMRSLAVCCDELAMAKYLHEPQNSWDGVKVPLLFQSPPPSPDWVPQAVPATPASHPVPRKRKQNIPVLYSPSPTHWEFKGPCILPSLSKRQLQGFGKVGDYWMEKRRWIRRKAQKQRQNVGFSALPLWLWGSGPGQGLQSCLGTQTHQQPSKHSHQNFWVEFWCGKSLF